MDRILIYIECYVIHASIAQTYSEPAGVTVLRNGRQDFPLLLRAGGRYSVTSRTQGFPTPSPSRRALQCYVTDARFSHTFS